MLSKLAEEARDSLVSTVKGADDVLDALRGAVKGQVTGALKDVADVATTGLDSVVDVVSGAVSGAGVIGAADDIGSEAGSVVRKALLSAAALPHDVIEAAVKGVEKEEK